MSNTLGFIQVIDFLCAESTDYRSRVIIVTIPPSTSTGPRQLVKPAFEPIEDTGRDPFPETELNKMSSKISVDTNYVRQHPDRF